MSKKKNLEQEVLISETEETTDAVVVTDESEVKPAKEEEKVSKNSKQENKSKDDKSKNKKDKKPKEKGKFKRKARETMSELKKLLGQVLVKFAKRRGLFCQ